MAETVAGGGTMQAFRVQRSQPDITVASGNDAESGQVQEPEQQYHSRRPHNKSRLGCNTCRRRRKKCDEGKPRCGFCTKRNVRCEYNDERLIKRVRIVSANDSPSQDALVRRARLGGGPCASIWPAASAPQVLVDRNRFTQHDLYLLTHFIQNTARAFGSDYVAEIYNSQVIGLALDHPYLMHALIAISACHLQHLGIDGRAYRLPEAFHIQNASEGLRENVVCIRGQRDSDAILTTAMLLNSLTFCAVDYRDEASSLVGRHAGPRWDWLRIQIGLTSLLAQTKPYHPETIWGVVFGMSDFVGLYSSVNPADCFLGTRLAQFCGIDETSNPDNNIYYDTVDILSPLLAREPSLELFPLYIRVIGSITSGYIDLLEQNDTKALLVFVHWLALMCAVEQWWSVRRTRRECYAICGLLSHQFMLQGESDDRIVELLEYPAKACGYQLPQWQVEDLLWDPLETFTTVFERGTITSLSPSVSI